MPRKHKPKSKSTTPTASPGELAELRKSIDDLDQRLVGLLNRRAELVVKVGKIKKQSGAPTYAPHREAEVLNKVLGLNKGPLHGRTIEGVYRELMSGSFRLEEPVKIGYLGPPGTYSHLAAVKNFGTSVDFEDLHAIEGVFNEVARGHVDYGLVPIENSIGGGIVETLEAFQEMHTQVNIYAELQIDVQHALLANCPAREIGKIYSKPEIFQQCRTWLATQFPNAQLIPDASSSSAVKHAAEASRTKTKSKGNSPQGIAAIGSTLAGEIYGVKVLFENIQDRANNITRFFVISKHKAQPTGKDTDGKPGDKTSIMFSTSNEPGALVGVLGIFHRAGINLTHIDKRPSGRQNWQYSFFIDAEGHIQDPWFAAAIAQAQGHCRELHVLGSYPRSRRIL